MNRTISSMQTGLILLSLLFCIPTAFAASQAGKVVYAYGQVMVTDAEGDSRDVKRASPIYAGDTLKTENGRMQIRFRDGGFISLQNDSEFAISDYQFSGTEDGKESAIFSLLKGGFRAITGLIGRKDKSRYKVKSTVATIGIRGTAYYARLCQGDCFKLDGSPIPDGLHTKTGEGTIYVMNTAGILDIPAGKSAFVKNATTLPEVMENAIPLKVKQQIKKKLVTSDRAKKIAAVIGDQFAEGGQQTSIVGVSDGGPFLSYGSSIHPTFFLFEVNRQFLNAGTGRFTDTGGNKVVINKGTLTVKNTYFDNTIAVGRWAGPGHFVRSINGGPFQPSPLFVGSQSVGFANGTYIDALPTAGQAFYKLIPDSAIPSTSVNGNSIGAGLISGGIGVDFTTATAFLNNFRVRHAGNVYQIAGSAPVLTNQDSQGMVAAFGGILSGGSFTATGSGCGPSCPSDVQGQLHGSQATSLGKTPSHATAIYGITHPVEAFGGAAGFKLDSVTP